MHPRRLLTVVVFLTIFAAIVFIGRYGRETGRLKNVEAWIKPGATKEKAPEGRPCTEHLGWLEPYQLTYPIKYATREILTVPSGDGARPSLTVIEHPLFEEFTTFDMAKSATINQNKCLPPLTLEVPRGKVAPADASDMIFGMQTTMKRLKETVKHLARWLPHTGARLYTIVIDGEDLPADDLEMKALEKQFHDLGMNVSVIHPVRTIDSFAQRYFSLVGVMYEARNERTRWITTIDDDTFFPSMHDLKDLLSKYDVSKPQYIGSLSEDWWAVNHYGLMGFGGAGILLSMPTAKVIYDHLDDCKEHLRTTAGDISVMDCIYDHSSVKLTHVPSLHQVDMHGDLSGFYESGREMTSLHHWKEGSAAEFKLEIEKMHLVADVCDSCFLQRWQFPKELVLTNGFSINEYPQGHISGTKLAGVLSQDKIDLEQMEQTWGDKIQVLHSLHPVRPKMTNEEKLSYKLLDSVQVPSDASVPGLKDTVRQVYFKKGKEIEGIGRDLDQVIVINWRAGPQPEPESKPLP